MEYAKNSNNHVPSLITDSPYEGRLLAIKLVRKTTGTLQTDIAVKPTVRQTYTDDAQLLMHAAKLVAIEFKTIAIANHYWHGEE